MYRPAGICGAPSGSKSPCLSDEAQRGDPASRDDGTKGWMDC